MDNITYLIEQVETLKKQIEGLSSQIQQLTNLTASTNPYLSDNERSAALMQYQDTKQRKENSATLEAAFH